MKSIETNGELGLLLETIRNAFSNDHFESELEIDAYFKASILIFNNLKEPYWRGVKKGEIKYDDYFQSKMDITFSNNKSEAINQLYKLWIDKKTTTIEYNLRGLLFIAREHSFEFDKDIIGMIVEVLSPLVEKAKLKHAEKAIF